MIESVNIENYKALKSLEVQQCGQVTIIGGKNNVGKTSLLEAIFIFFDRIQPEAVVRPNGWRGMTSFITSREGAFRPLFTSFDTSKPISISLRMGRVKERLRISVADPKIRRSPSTTLPADGRREKQDQRPPRFAEGALSLSYSTSASKGERHSEVRITPEGLEMDARGFPVDNRPAIYMGLRTGGRTEDDAARFAELDIANRTNEVTEFLRAFFPQIREISAVPLPGQSMLYADVGLPRKIPVPLLGDGAARLLSVFLAICTAKGGVVLIDEFGVGLHYSLLPALWRAIHRAAGENGTQVFATTHSQEVLQAAQSAYSELLTADERDFSYVRLDQKEAETTATTYRMSEFQTALNMGWDVR